MRTRLGSKGARADQFGWLAARAQVVSTEAQEEPVAPDMHE